MNYIELLNMFYERIQCSRVSNNGQLLYYTLLAINNKSSWSDWFSRTNVSISGMMGISEKAFANARAELKQLGLIDFISSKKRGECTKYRILYPTKYGTNRGTKEVQTPVQSADINKQETKTKKSNTSVLPEKTSPTIGKAVHDADLFERLWKLYPEKKGKGQISAKQKQRIAEAGEEQMARAIGRYKKELEKDREWRQPQNGSTFFNSGYVDYLDVNFVPSEEKEKAKPGNGKDKNRFHNLDDHGYDYEKMMWENINPGEGENGAGN